MDVIAHILHDLKCRLLTALKDDDTAVKDDGTELTASDFDWVITVPAFWKDDGKSMMREAGYMVRTCMYGSLFQGKLAGRSTMIMRS